MIASVGARARLNDLTFTLGGAVVRNQIFLRLDGEGIEADIRGTSLLSWRQHADTMLVADHAAGGCRTRELFKSVLDDVQCGHGATAGALDGELKFYLMARGIPEKEAEALLIQSFVGEAVETIAHDGVRADLMFAAVRWLGARGS